MAKKFSNLHFRCFFSYVSHHLKRPPMKMEEARNVTMTTVSKEKTLRHLDLFEKQALNHQDRRECAGCVPLNPPEGVAAGIVRTAENYTM
ncbi:hypothetical protein CEXT_291231 [Caerostris extrusa]|uniref:Uncharacterized protein n=1 Tax=Caerostris extrusa TaxID=172846 RepID=A0AAV4XXM0_CAEEX|nr:hypothetical protein CEXT_291231 [Caerostris extrusa]